jgi:hypothetical protein
MIGLTTATGALDWVSVVNAGAGLVMIAEGMYRILRTRGAAGTPEAARPSERVA